MWGGVVNELNGAQNIKSKIKLIKQGVCFSDLIEVAPVVSI